MIVLVIFLFTFSFSFFLIAQNQINFDNLSDDDKNGISYSDLMGAIQYICNLLYGEADSDAFGAGDASMEALLNTLFWLAVFIIMILLLNMLIAIMGNTFAVGNESLEQQKYREHLRFVVDNWFLRELAFSDIRGVKYIITAFSAADDEGDDPVFDEIKDEIRKQQESVSNMVRVQGDQLKDMKRMMAQLIKSQHDRAIPSSLENSHIK